MAKDPLHDLTEFTRLTPAKRKALAGAIVAKLGKGWSAEAPSKDLDGLPLQHEPTGLAFVVVPGGSFEMGLTQDDIAAVKAYLGKEWNDSIAASLKNSPELAPVHRVQVAPFIVARGRLSAREVERLSKKKFKGPTCQRVGWKDARALAKSYGLRLPSEAELEWLAREGGTTHFTTDAAEQMKKVGGDSSQMRSRFGVVDLFEFQWAEDDYHPTYDGAPKTSVPWTEGGAGVGVARGLGRPEYVNEPEQITGLLAALRTNETQKSACVRFAHSLPALAG